MTNMLGACFLVLVISSVVRGDYWEERQQLIQDEQILAIGGKLQLTSREIEVNQILMNLKAKEMEDGFNHPEKFPPAMHFFKGKHEIEKSAVFSILKKMPKGGILHNHDTALGSAEWLVKNVTYRDNLYICNKNGTWILAFVESQPNDDCWRSVANLRNNSENKDKFDHWLKQKFTLVVENPEEIYPDINTAWQAFMKIFAAITPMLTYQPVFEDYLYTVLQSFYDDNILYVEMRGTLPPIYNLNGSETTPVETVGIMEKIVQRFNKDHPDFLGMKFIYAPGRRVDNKTLEEYLNTFHELQKAYPKFIVGFDLVGQEDTGKPLIDFVTYLRANEKDTKYFFHAGETNWYGMSTDLNLVDAVLLNTTRIGHGYAIIKHPRLLEEIKKRGIALEVNPISNQVLLLVKDLRNHPANVLFSQDYPVVVSSDDPGFWGADGLSHDFYMAFMGMASSSADLRMLKQLAINSIKYSALSESEKGKAMEIFSEKWEYFLSEIIEKYSNKINISENIIQ